MTLRQILEMLSASMCTSHCWVKTADGPRRIVEPFDAMKLNEHLAKRKAYGLCPIKPGENTTRTAILDLDSHKGETSWADMLVAARMLESSLLLDGYFPTLFRSSGGHGIHLWLIWDHDQDAYSVREMLREHLAHCGFENGTGGVSTNQVEVFPKQSSVAPDGFGSMVILPFAGLSEQI
jgi:hypothetical protein